MDPPMIFDMEKSIHSSDERDGAYDLHMPWWQSVGFERPSVQNGAKMGITREEIKNLLKEAIEPLERKLDNLNNVRTT